VYDVLSLNPDGSDLTVYATGMRQPWQIAFAKGSNTPFVSVLGQDSGAKNPPDFVLEVSQGDDYGFPSCNWEKPKQCTGFTTPFQQFAPHTDIMGLAPVGDTLYMTSFVGGGKGTGEVVSMPITGGTTTPLLSGFVAPTVGLGAHGQWLYVGELNGQVLRVKVS
jgi:glucose/arabinose dehydrogenase